MTCDKFMNDFGKLSSYMMWIPNSQYLRLSIPDARYTTETYIAALGYVMQIDVISSAY